MAAAVIAERQSLSRYPNEFKRLPFFDRRLALRFGRDDEAARLFSKIPDEFGRKRKLFRGQRCRLSYDAYKSQLASGGNPPGASRVIKFRDAGGGPLARPGRLA